MSHSPVDSSEFDSARNAESAYRQGLAHLNDLLRHGGTLSGHEANCAFLNTQGGPFATVSAVSGFDYPDDGRGLALVDWDADGDVDVWVSNRTGPRVRFLRNEIPHDNHFVAFRLEGRSCNRDAIGARVELLLEDDSDTKLMRSLRAGEGFLSQSSKWLLFGLGASREIPQVTVRWPDGHVQHHRNVMADQHYRVVQGEPNLRTCRRRQDVLKILPSASDALPRTDRSTTTLTHPIPLPRLPFRSDDPSRRQWVTMSSDRPVLVNLWAAWCGPCLGELQEFTNRAHDIRAARLDVVAVNVERVSPDEQYESPAAAEILTRMNFPFASVEAEDELIARLRTAHQLPFVTHVDLPLPISFLVDTKQRVVTIYRGPVDVDQLIADVANLSLSDERRALLALPLPGRWNEPPAPPKQPAPLRIARELLDRGQVDDTLEYVTRCADQLHKSDEFAKLRVWLGNELLAARQTDAGLNQFELALNADPDNLIAMNNLAWQLATHPDSKVRNGPLAMKWAERAAAQTGHRDSGILDTLAASYAEAGRYAEAVKAAEQSLNLIDRSANTEVASTIEQRLQGYRQGRPYRRPSD